MPPTFAAATKTAWGWTSRIHRSTCAGSRRSRRWRGAVTTSQFSLCRRRWIALPTRPRWPATQTRLPAREYWFRSGIAELVLLHGQAIGFDHFGDQFLEGGLVAPADAVDRLAGAALQEIHLGRPVVGRVDGDQCIGEIGCVAGRERVVQYVEICGVACSL